MSQFDVVAVPASRDYSTFADLKLGRSSQTVVGRILRHWDARNYKRQCEFMGVVFLLLDEQDSVIQGFIPASRAPHYRQALREGVVVTIRSFEVARAVTTYKLTEHPFLLRFLPTTTIPDARNVVTSISHERFLLRTNEQLHSLANTNSELLDVVGQIRFVQGGNLTDPTSTERVVVRFRIDTEVTVYLTLWDDAVATFRAHLSSENHSNAVMLVTTVNPKIFGGSLYLNSTPATRFIFGYDCGHIQEFTERLEGRTFDVYRVIHDWIMRKFRSDPNTQVEVKDLTRLEVGDSKSKQEVMEFLDYWGLINFHPFSSTNARN